MEIIIVIVIVGIAAGILTTGGWRRSFEKQRGLEAMHNLQLIYNAEKRRLLDQGDYFSCSPCAAKDITDNLGILVSPNYFTYSITAFSLNQRKGFEAVAVRKSGICRGRRMWLNQSSSDVVKGCEAWE